MCLGVLLLASVLHAQSNRRPRYYDSLSFEKVYGDTIPAPPADLTVALEDKSLSELRLLRNGVFARHGYLFTNSQLRGYFNQFDWYQPVYWEEDYQIVLSDAEQRFIDRVLREEKERLADQYQNVHGLQLANPANMVNDYQFKHLSPALLDTLARQSFAIYPEPNRQMHHIYEENKYAGIPSFVTTDSYLHLLHIHYKDVLRNLEADEFIGLMQTLTGDLFQSCLERYTEPTATPALNQARAFNLLYTAVASALCGNETSIPANLQARFSAEYGKANAASGEGAVLLGDPNYQFEELTPRGHYVVELPPKPYPNAGSYRTNLYSQQVRLKENLAAYFKTVKWLNTAPIFIDDQVRLLAAVDLALTLKSDADLFDAYQKYVSTVNFFAGEADNLTILDLIELLDEMGITDAGSADLLAIRATLAERDPARIVAKSSIDAQQSHFNRPRLLFLPSYYSFDAHVLQNMINPNMGRSGDRPFPKGLDIFAAFGDSTATQILLNEYKEAENWSGYPEALASMRQKVSEEFDSTGSMYGLRLDLCRDLTVIADACPDFMRTNAWGRKSLNTALSGWTELKHEMVLYMKQPFGAESGEGGGPPPPVIPGYVEPHLAFWQGAANLISYQTELFDQNGVNRSRSAFTSNKLLEMAQRLEELSAAELAGKGLSDDDFRYITYIGSGMEQILSHGIGGASAANLEPLPLAIDVYAHQQLGQLIEGIGDANPIFVLVEINGLLYLTRGAVFSYYEFTSPTVLTDQQWRSQLSAGSVPERPVWMQPLLLDGTPPDSKPGYGLEAYRYSGYR